MMLRQLVLVTLVLASPQAEACSLIPPSRPPTLPEKLGGVEEIFGGTVVGYVNDDGSTLLGSPPPQCLDEQGIFDWPDWERMRALPACAAYAGIWGALFRVDVAIVGPAMGEFATYYMTWGDGDCNQDFNVGEQWLIAGPVIEELQAPIREDEIATLQRLAAHPAFDMQQLYR